jgi:hypothetical protein
MQKWMTASAPAKQRGEILHILRQVDRHRGADIAAGGDMAVDVVRRDLRPVAQRGAVLDDMQRNDGNIVPRDELRRQVAGAVGGNTDPHMGILLLILVMPIISCQGKRRINLPFQCGMPENSGRTRLPLLRYHRRAAAARARRYSFGSVTMNVLPSPSTDSTEIAPAHSSSARRTMASPDAGPLGGVRAVALVEAVEDVLLDLQRDTAALVGDGDLDKGLALPQRQRDPPRLRAKT